MGWFERMALKHVKYHVWNELPVQVRCTIPDAWGWCTGTTQRDGIRRVVGGGLRMGNTCIPVVDSCCNKHAHTSFRPNVCSLAHLIKDAWCRHWLISFYFPADFFIGAIFQNLYGFFFPVCFVLLWIALLWWTCASILSSQTFEPLWIFLISINSSSVLLPNDVLFLPP